MVKLKRNLHIIRRKISKEAPILLTGVGVIGVVATAYLAAVATPKAVNLIEEAKTDNPDISKKDIVILALPLYIPSVLVGSITIGSIIGANNISSKRLIAMSTAYRLVETAAGEYRNKVLEVVGKKKEEAIRAELARDKVSEIPPVDIFATGHGDHLMMDSLSGRYFKSDIEHVRRAVNLFNKTLLDDTCGTLNDFWDLLNLPPTELGTYLGWDLGLDYPLDSLLQVTFTTIIEPSTGAPCIVLNYNIHPKN